MTKILSTLAAVAVVLGAAAAASVSATAAGERSAGGTTLTVYSGRDERFAKPILDRFTAATGIELRVRYGDSATLAATLLEEGANSPADVFFAQDAGALGAVASKGRLRVLPDATLRRVPARFRAPGKRWVGVSGRARVVAYNTDTVRARDLPKTIWGFTQPRWRGKVGLPPTNASFQAFVTAMRMRVGNDRTRDWLLALKANDVKFFPSNARVLDAVASREIEVGLVNHYYLYQLKEQRPTAPVANHFLTRQEGSRRAHQRRRRRGRDQLEATRGGTAARQLPARPRRAALLRAQPRPGGVPGRGRHPAASRPAPAEPDRGCAHQPRLARLRACRARSSCSRTSATRGEAGGAPRGEAPARGAPHLLLTARRGARRGRRPPPARLPPRPRRVGRPAGLGGARARHHGTPRGRHGRAGRARRRGDRRDRRPARLGRDAHGRARAAVLGRRGGAAARHPELRGGARAARRARPARPAAGLPRAAVRRRAAARDLRPARRGARAHALHVPVRLPARRRCSAPARPRARGGGARTRAVARLGASCTSRCPPCGPRSAAGSLLVALYTISDFGVVSLMQYPALTRAIYLQYGALFDRDPAIVLAARARRPDRARARRRDALPAPRALPPLGARRGARAVRGAARPLALGGGRVLRARRRLLPGPAARGARALDARGDRARPAARRGLGGRRQLARRRRGRRGGGDRGGAARRPRRTARRARPGAGAPGDGRQRAARDRGRALARLLRRELHAAALPDLRAARLRLRRPLRSAGARLRLGHAAHRRPAPRGGRARPRSRHRARVRRRDAAARPLAACSPARRSSSSAP